MNRRGAQKLIVKSAFFNTASAHQFYVPKVEFKSCQKHDICHVPTSKNRMLVNQ